MVTLSLEAGLLASHLHLMLIHILNNSFKSCFLHVSVFKNLHNFLLCLLHPAPHFSFSFDLEEHKSYNRISPHRKTSCTQKRKVSVQRHRTKIFLPGILTPSSDCEIICEQPAQKFDPTKAFLTMLDYRQELENVLPSCSVGRDSCSSLQLLCQQHQRCPAALTSSCGDLRIYSLSILYIFTVVLGSHATISWDKRSNSASCCKSSAPVDLAAAKSFSIL